MITIKNYHETIKSKGIKRSDLGEKLQKGWDFVEKIWQSGKESWKAYESSEKIKNTVDTYFKLMDEFVKGRDKSTTKRTSTPSKTSRKKKSRAKSSVPKGKGDLFSIVINYEDENGKQKSETVFIRIADRSKFKDSDYIHKKGIERFKKDFKGAYKKVIKADEIIHINPSPSPKQKKKVSTQKSKPKSKPKIRSTKKSYVDPNVKKVEVFSLEHKFIKRFVNMDGKAKTRNQTRLFINALQKKIREKEIRKTSKYASHIVYIQDALIKLHSRFKNDEEKIEVVLPAKKKADFLKILGRQIEIPSVKLIKSYINLQGKLIPNKKAKNLYNRIVRAIDKGKITKRDKYWREIESILERLTTFVKKNPTSGILTIESRALNGLEGIVGDCGCEPQQFESFGRIPDNVVMSSVDVLKLKFEKLGFTGKWLDFIGNPAKNFSMMIFGLPKYGKSILAIAFASYLANNFGTVLYVAREEGIDDTLQEKLEKVAHPDLFVVGSLPDDLEQFDFVFLDSVNKLGMTPKDIDALRAKYPGKGFVTVFQTRKDGNFRGSQEFQHDVDIVIELPELGRAVQYGRYNQGGEMNIFSGSLDGIKKK